MVDLHMLLWVASRRMLIQSLNPLAVRDLDPDGWYPEQLHRLRADGHPEREVVLHL
jgi:hypothetical protein